MTQDSSKPRKTLIDAELWPDDDTDIWDAAWFYASRLNWAVMPVENGGKKPVLSDWQKLTHDDSLKNIGSSNGSAHSWRREFPRANLGLVCGPASGVAVIDIDNKTDPDTGESGPDQWRTLCQSLVDRPPWVTCARTPTGGMHVFFSSASLPFGSKNGQIATKIDFKAGAPDGTGVGQVVIAPSRREINGVVRHYGWVTRSISRLPAYKGNLPTAPEWLAVYCCFKPVERDLLDGSPQLKKMVLANPRADWRASFDALRAAEKRLQQNSVVSPGNRTQGSDLSLGHPYVEAALSGELATIRNCVNAQNATLNASAFAVGTLLAGLGDAVSEGATEKVRQALQGAAMQMRAIDQGKPWSDKLGQEAARKTIESGLRAGLARPRDLSAVLVVKTGGTGTALVPITPPVSKLARTGSQLQVAWGDDLANEVQPLRWLWHDYIPRGVITNIIGQAKVGKSQLTCLIAAHVTTGRPWPGSDKKRKPGVVIFLAAEDPKSVIVSRLEVAKADMSRFLLLSTKKPVGDKGETVEQTMSLQTDLAQLEALIQKLKGGEKGGVRAIIVDPITAYMGRADTHKSSDVRNALSAFVMLADKYDIAIIAVTHRNKSLVDVTDAMDAATGSHAFTALARGNLFVGRDPKDPDSAVRIMKAHGQNLAKDDIPAWSFSIESATWKRKKDNKKFKTAKAVWGDKVIGVDPMELLTASPNKARPMPKWVRAAVELRQLLDDEKSHPQKPLIAKLTKQLKTVERTIGRAAKHLGVKSIEPENAGQQGAVYKWRLTSSAKAEFDAWHTKQRFAR